MPVWTKLNLVYPTDHSWQWCTFSHNTPSTTTCDHSTPNHALHRCERLDLRVGNFFFLLPSCKNTPAKLEKTGTLMKSDGSHHPITPFLAWLQHLQDLHSHSQKTVICTSAAPLHKRQKNMNVYFHRESAESPLQWSEKLLDSGEVVCVGIKCHILANENKFSAASACCDLSTTFFFFKKKAWYFYLPIIWDTL